MLPVEIVPVDGTTLVLRARGSELLILPHHIAELKPLKSPKDFTNYFLNEALLNRPARKLFEAWLRKDTGLWQRIYTAVQKDMDLEKIAKFQAEIEGAPSKPKSEKKAAAPAKSKAEDTDEAPKKVSAAKAKATPDKKKTAEKEKAATTSKKTAAPAKKKAEAKPATAKKKSSTAAKPAAKKATAKTSKKK